MAKVVSDSAGRRGAKPLGETKGWASMQFVLISKIRDTVDLL